MIDPEKWYDFTPHQSITAFDLAKILAASEWAFRGNLITRDMEIHFTEKQPPAPIVLGALTGSQANPEAKHGTR